MMDEQAEKWRRFYAAVDRLIEVAEPVRSAKDGDVIVLPHDEFERFKNDVEATIAELREAQKDLGLS